MYVLLSGRRVGWRACLVSASSQLSSAQNNPYVKVAYFRVAFSATLYQPPKLLPFLLSTFHGSFSCSKLRTFHTSLEQASDPFMALLTPHLSDSCSVVTSSGKPPLTSLTSSHSPIRECQSTRFLSFKVLTIDTT